MPLTGFATVSTMLAALAGIAGDSPVVVKTVDTKEFLGIREITLATLEKQHREDEATILALSDYVVIVVDPPKPSGVQKCDT